MTTTMSIRDLARGGDNIAEYDYVEIKNQKSKKYHGLFITPKYAKEMKEILDKKIANDKKAKLKELDSFVGMLRGKIGEDRIGDIKSKYAKN